MNVNLFKAATPYRRKDLYLAAWRCCFSDVYGRFSIICLGVPGSSQNAAFHRSFRLRLSLFMLYVYGSLRVVTAEQQIKSSFPRETKRTNAHAAAMRYLRKFGNWRLKSVVLDLDSWDMVHLTLPSDLVANSIRLHFYHVRQGRTDCSNRPWL